MNTEVNTPRDVLTGFEKGYDELPRKAFTKVRDKIMDKTGWDLTTFHRKRRGDSKIFKPEISIVEACFAEWNINPWTGEKLSA